MVDQKPILTLRDAQRSDITRLTDIEVETSLIISDPITNIVFPTRHQQPGAFRNTIREGFRDMFFQSSETRTIVAEVQFGGPEGPREVVGYVNWELNKAAVKWIEELEGEKGEEMRKMWTSQMGKSSWLEEHLLALESKYNDFMSFTLRPPPAARAAQKIARSKKPFTAIFNCPAIAMHGIAVDVRYQRRGYARQLMEWGMQRTKDLPIMLMSLPTARDFYASIGFVELAKLERGEYLMAWTPEGLEVDFDQYVKD